MKTVEWKGITLTMVPVYASSCSLVINKERVWCAMADEHSTSCNSVCPEGPGILLEGASLEKYLAAKLMGEIG